jgi:hypothetical protein
VLVKRWNVTIGEYLPYLTSRVKTAFPADIPSLESHGNWLHAIGSGSYVFFSPPLSSHPLIYLLTFIYTTFTEKLQWSASIQAPPVNIYTLAGNTHLQKVDFAYSVPSLPSSSDTTIPSSTHPTVIAPQAHVFVAVLDDQPFSTSNPTIVYHNPYLLPSLPSSSTPSPPASLSSDSNAGTGIIQSPTSSPFMLPSGLYPVINLYDRWDNENENETINEGEMDMDKHTRPLPPQILDLIENRFFLPLLATVFTCVTVGGFWFMKSRKKGKKRSRSNSTNKKTTTNSLPPTTTSPPQPTQQKEKEEKKVTENNATTEKPSGEIASGEMGGGSGGSGETKNNNGEAKNNNNTPAKRKTPNKRKSKPSAQLNYFSNTKNKRKNNNNNAGEGEGEAGEGGNVVVEGEGEVEGEREGVEEENKVSTTKSVRIITENGITKIGKLEITQTILGIHLSYSKISLIFFSLSFYPPLSLSFYPLSSLSRFILFSFCNAISKRIWKWRNDSI